MAKLTGRQVAIGVAAAVILAGSAVLIWNATHEEGQAKPVPASTSNHVIDQPKSNQPAAPVRNAAPGTVGSQRKAPGGPP